MPGALRLQRHKPIRFKNRNEYARSSASRSQHVYLMLKNGEWRVLDGVGTKGNPRWPSVRRVLGEHGLRVPGITRKHDDHDDPTVIAAAEALVWNPPSSAACCAFRPLSITRTKPSSEGAPAASLILGGASSEALKGGSPAARPSPKAATCLSPRPPTAGYRGHRAVRRVPLRVERLDCPFTL